MSEKVKFLTTFRARLILLLTSFLLITLALVFILDNWSRKRTEEAVEAHRNQVAESLNIGYYDLALAINLATQSLESERYLYDSLGPGELPRTIENIVVTEENGKVRDCTLREKIDQHIRVPVVKTFQVRSEDPLHEEDASHEHAPKTYYQPINTASGVFWIVIVTTQQSILNRVEDSSKTLTSTNKELANYRLAATTGLLVMALALAVVIGWRFTRPINKLAAAAQRVAAGELDFSVGIDRSDEVGQLAATFDEMILGLRAKIELEEKLNQSERAAVIGRLTQSVAHEIRNPLNVINLSIDHVSSKYAPEDERQRKQFTRILSSIKDEIGRLKHMVNDLLNYGRPARLTFEMIDMRELIDDTLSFVRSQADEQGVEVTFEDGEGPAEVLGDRERLKSCLSNIAINALQAMPAGGELHAWVEKSNGLVEVHISDTGIGISEEALTKIFEPYYSTKKTGFGLGLAVTKNIVEEHRGMVEVLSELDRGTTFIVRLPATADEPETEI
ncbi:MAG: ATP-binding protein [Blastocatellia bacterium]|nr:ATP-binding protein [Blastocatellia bacterium]